MENKEKLPFRPALFWDTNRRNIDIVKNAQYVIERILDFGRDSEIRWLWGAYDRGLLKKVVVSSRVLRPETKSLWTLMLQDH